MKKILFAALLLNSLLPANAQVNVKDSLALTDLYNNTNGPNWTFNGGWLTSAPVSTWFGITVSGTRVAQVILDLNNLKGKLPPTIGNLTAITSFNVSFNKLTGFIPDSVGNLVNLQRLDLSYNNLSGNIPASITRLEMLEQLLLEKNQLSGGIPDSISRLSNLSYINISYNNLNGTIPASFGDMPKLAEIYLNRNQLTGIIPPSLGNLTGMLVLDLGYNQLTGIIPPSLANLTELFDIYLNNNQLSGNVPRLTVLFDIDLSHNKLSQSNNVPVMGPTDYTGVDLRYNSFTFNGLEYAEVKLPNAKYKYQQLIPVHVYNKKLTVSAGGTLDKNTYYWYHAGDAQATIITGDSTFKPKESGQYYAAVTNSIAKKLTLTTDTVSYTLPLAKKATIEASLYPNPASNTLTVDLTSLHGMVILKLYDSQNKIIQVKKSAGQAQIQFDVHQLTSGLYTLVISDNNGNTKSIKWIKE
jgi:Leucine rich repeat/Secretion system C-terminal sorting domain